MEPSPLPSSPELDELLAAHAVLRDPIDAASAPGAARGLDPALAARRPGRSLLRPDADATVVEVHGRRAAALHELVRGLGPHEWRAPTRLGRSVQELLAHLAGQLERATEALAAQVAPEPEADYDHWEVTAPFVARFGTGDPAPLAAALVDVNARLAALLPSAVGDVHDLSSPAAQALVKVYELWMHTDDVRLALGRPVEVPDAASLGTLCALAADAVPVVLSAVGAARPGASVRLVLTGTGGGVWRRSLALGVPAPDAHRPDDVTVVAEAHRFCRLFHAQVTPDELDAHVEGDRALGAALLAAAGVLAERT